MAHESSWDELIDDGMRRMHIAEGSCISGPGDELVVGVLAAGLLRHYVATTGGRQFTIHYSRAGELVGIARYLAATPAWTTEAMVDSTLVIVPVALIRERSAREPELCWRIAEHVAVWTTQVIRLIADTSHQRLDAVLAYHLLEIAQRSPEGRPVAYVSHERLAEAAGTVREVVSRELRALRDMGCIAASVGRIVIIDEERLKTIAAGSSEPTHHSVTPII